MGIYGLTERIAMPVPICSADSSARVVRLRLVLGTNRMSSACIGTSSILAAKDNAPGLDDVADDVDHLRFWHADDIVGHDQNVSSRICRFREIPQRHFRDAELTGGILCRIGQW